MTKREQYEKFYDLLQKYQVSYHLVVLSPVPIELEVELAELGFRFTRTTSTMISPAASIDMLEEQAKGKVS